jgi:hypothetical protein
VLIGEIDGVVLVSHEVVVRRGKKLLLLFGMVLNVKV